MKKFIKFNSPKPRKHGAATIKCRRCGRIGGHIGKYDLNLCRSCFREVAISIGFKKYS
ncbi:MAG TPA: 30S ribosomal protein S14 [Candidatus Nanoarchaeia archaeon]|nr:30S ribosomal protein S14 [Candidatus Nanoarchaeia archaeon]